MYVPFPYLATIKPPSLGGSPGSWVSRSGVYLGSHVLMKNVPRSSIQPSKSLSVILLGTFNNEFDGSRIVTGALDISNVRDRRCDIDDLDFRLRCRIDISSLDMRVSHSRVSGLQLLVSDLCDGLYHKITGSRRNRYRELQRSFISLPGEIHVA